MKTISILESITKFFKRSEDKSVNIDSGGWYDIFESSTKSKAAMSEITYYTCMKVLSESIGKLPLRLLQKTEDGGTVVAKDHPLYRVLLERPNPHMTATTFWSTIEYMRNHYGNAYALIMGAGRNTTLWIIPSVEMNIIVDNKNILPNNKSVIYQWTSSAGIFYFTPEEILHFKGSHTKDGLVGISVREQLATTIGSSIKSQEMLDRLYSSDFSSKAVLKYTSDLSQANAKKLTEKLAEQIESQKTKDKIIPLMIGFDLIPLNMKLSDSQFVEIKQYTALQIAAAFGVKPYQIGDYTKSSFASAEAQNLSFITDTLLFILKNREEEIDYKLLSDEDISKGYFTKFNVDVLLRSDFATRVRTLAQAVSGSLMKPDEAREMLDLGYVDGGDVLLGNGNLIPIKQAGAQYNTSTAGDIENNKSAHTGGDKNEK